MRNRRTSGRSAPRATGTSVAPARDSTRRAFTVHLLGEERLYALNPAPLAKAAAWFEGYRVFWQRNLNSLKRYLEDT